VPAREARDPDKRIARLEAMLPKFAPVPPDRSVMGAPHLAAGRADAFGDVAAQIMRTIGPARTADKP
jgi:hypothetical protein